MSRRRGWKQPVLTIGHIMESYRYHLSQGSTSRAAIKATAEQFSIAEYRVLAVVAENALIHMQG